MGLDCFAFVVNTLACLQSHVILTARQSEKDNLVRVGVLELIVALQTSDDRITESSNRWSNFPLHIHPENQRGFRKWAFSIHYQCPLTSAKKTNIQFENHPPRPHIRSPATQLTHKGTRSWMQVSLRSVLGPAAAAKTRIKIGQLELLKGRAGRKPKRHSEQKNRLAPPSVSLDPESSLFGQPKGGPQAAREVPPDTPDLRKQLGLDL